MMVRSISKSEENEPLLLLLGLSFVAQTGMKVRLAAAAAIENNAAGFVQVLKNRPF